jgi:DNA-binding LytR/AlgR family response regulator
MRSYNCIVIEDEPLAVEIMQDYIQQVPFLSLKKVCTDAISAMEILHHEKIDLIFLDIHLPKLKGLDFLSTLKNPPKVIITTAYHQYALKSYDYHVVDYLLKPIEFNRFLTAVNKIKPDLPAVAEQNELSTERVHFFFNVAKKKVKIFVDEILYIEAQKEYIKIRTREKTILTKFQLSSLEELLPAANFIRVHRSFIIAKDKVEAFSIYDIEIGGAMIPIGRNYKELVMSQLG